MALNNILIRCSTEDNMNIIIALLLMTNVESSFDLKSKEQYSAVKKTVQVVRLISGIK
jgi:hypothetical protein|tara:strand:+ start:325 stop:498 length:174 start_codon:yes stop_codon:yes gene_type:complete